MRADYIAPEILDHILAALTVQNELAMRVSLATGLRIDDVLSLYTCQLEQAKNNRITVIEEKTKKRRRVYIPESLKKQMLARAGLRYVFESRTDWKKHRTRQAVWKDLKRAADAFRVTGKLNVSPHTARKVYAVEAFKKFGKPEKVQQLLQHNDAAVTALYLMAEEITLRKMGPLISPLLRR